MKDKYSDVIEHVNVVGRVSKKLSDVQYSFIPFVYMLVTVYF